MSSTAVCVDANLVVRAVAPDPDHDVLPLWHHWISTQTELFAPTLLRFEVVNAIHRKRMTGGISDGLAEEMVALALDLPITFVSEARIHLDALTLAGRFGFKAAYDAHYVALAQHLGAELWTADKRLYNAVQQHLDFVHLVE